MFAEVEPLQTSRPVASLAHGLDRVLFKWVSDNVIPPIANFSSPSVYWFQDPHSKVYNFPQAIQKIPDVRDFAFERVTGFVTSSKDTVITLSSVFIWHYLICTGISRSRKTAWKKIHRLDFISDWHTLTHLLSNICPQTTRYLHHDPWI